MILRRTTLVAVLAMTFAACSTSNGVSAGRSQTSETIYAAATTVPVANTTTAVAQTTAEPTTAVPPATEPSTSVSPPGEARFAYSSRYGDSEWQGTLAGFTMTTSDGLTARPGKCVVVLGTLTPSRISGRAISNWFSAPSFNLLVDGHKIDSSLLGCDEKVATTAGYRPLLDAQVTVGTSFAFYAAFALPSGQPDPETVSIVVGDPTSAGAKLLKLSAVSGVSPPAHPTVGPLTDTLLPADDPSASTISYSSGDTTWKVFIAGLVDSEVSSLASVQGRCVTVIGTFTPTKIGSGIVSTGRSAPSISVISRGTNYTSGLFSCSDNRFGEAGYGPTSDVAVTVGTSYGFYEQIFIPGGDNTAVAAIVVGTNLLHTVSLFEAKLLNNIPPV